MSIYNQIARLFKLTTPRLLAALAVSIILFVSALHAQTEGLRATASLDLEPAVVDGKPALAGKYQITCSIQDGRTTYGFGDIKLYYTITVGDNDNKDAVEVRGLSGLSADGGGGSKREAPLEVTGPLGGARVRAKMSGAFCHHDQLNSEMLTVWSPAVVIPPQISVVTAFNPDTPNATPYVSFMSPAKITDVTNVPVGKRLVLMLDINAHPQGTEYVVLHYEGAGVFFGQVLYDMEKDYQPMKEFVTPTEAGGTLKVWAEFRPNQVKSNVLQFHVVGDPNKPQTDDNSNKPKTVSNPDKSKAKKPSSVRKARH